MTTLDASIRSLSITNTASRVLQANRQRRRIVFLQGTDDYFVHPTAGSGVTTSNGIPVLAHTVIEGAVAQSEWWAISTSAAVVGGVLEVLAFEPEEDPKADPLSGGLRALRAYDPPPPPKPIFTEPRDGRNPVPRG